MTAALVVWALLLTLAWLISEGEPVCEGPLIVSVDDSMSPQCPAPVEGLIQVGPVLLGLIAFLAWCGFLVSTGVIQRRARSDVASSHDS